jgi:hypothetical protein
MHSLTTVCGFKLNYLHIYVHSRGINLGNKCCNRGRLGVVLEQGYKYEPLVFVIGIEQFHNKPAPCHLLSPFSRVVEFFKRSHRSVDLRKYRQPCIMSSIMQWI